MLEKFFHICVGIIIILLTILLSIILMTGSKDLLRYLLK